MKKHVRATKYDPFVEEVDLLKLIQLMLMLDCLMDAKLLYHSDI